MNFTTQTVHSSFLSVEKDLNIIISKMMKNERLKRLLYIDTEDCIDKPNLTQEETKLLINNRIKIVPKMKVDSDQKTYIVIRFDNFTPNLTNPAFRDNTISFDIFCHQDYWRIKDFQLRPYRIAAEIDTMFNNTHLTGIGTLYFTGAGINIWDDEFSGLTIAYDAIHGGEDNKPMANPADEKRFIEDFNSWNNG